RTTYAFCARRDVIVPSRRKMCPVLRQRNFTGREMDAPAHQLPASAHTAMLAALMAAAGSSLGDHLQFLLAIPVTLGAFVLVCVAAARVGRQATSRSYDAIDAALGANAGVAMTVGPPFGSAVWYQVLYWGYCAAAIVIVALARRGGLIGRRAIWIAIALAVALHVAVPIATPRPTIDVWTWTDACVRALLHGTHPYTAQAVDPTRGAYDFGYVTTVYPYMPLVVVANVPATAIFGDYRFGLALCLPLTIALLRSAGRRFL